MTAVARGTGTVVLAAAAVAAANYVAAKAAELLHPPAGRFMEVDGVRLHYRDVGNGRPVVLLHGNVVSGDDFDTSGLTDLLVRHHRVIIIDRPGFGYSERPRGKAWTAREQAELIHHAVQQLGVEKPVIVGHSWGSLVALEYAAAYQSEITGVVLIAGYYFWTLRPDALLMAPAAAPVLGFILRYTVSPLFGWLTMPWLTQALFAPAEVPARFEQGFSRSMSLRPWQMRAIAMDGSRMISAAFALRDSYRDLRVPVVIMAGDGDRIVSRRNAERLHETIAGSTLEIVPGAGHMLHYLSPGKVAYAINSLSR